MKAINEYKKVLLRVIFMQSAKIAAGVMKSHKPSHYTRDLLILAGIIITTSIFFQIWWLFIPGIVSYFIYDYVKRYSYIKSILPSIEIDVSNQIQTSTEKELIEIEEDLETKKHNGIYSKEEIEEIEDTIDLFQDTIKILKEHKNQLIDGI